MKENLLTSIPKDDPIKLRKSPVGRPRLYEAGESEARRRKIASDLRRLAVVVADSNDAITIQKPDGTITAWNRGAERMYGYSEAEAIGMNILELVPQAKREEARQALKRLAQGEVLESWETQRLTKDGRVLDVWLTETLLADDHGREAVIATTERDITDRKRAEKEKDRLLAELKTAIQNLERINQFKTRMMAVVAHDLRNPLYCVIGSCEWLLSESQTGNLNEKQIRRLKIIQNSSKAMNDLINDLLDVSRIESGRIELDLTPNDLHAVVQERLEISETVAKKKEIRIQKDLEEIPPFSFDRKRIGQVIDNLVSNAIKFSSRHSTVYVSLKNRGNVARVEVRDEGPGISEEDQKLMFGEFQTLSAKPTGGERSTGLGLNIAKNFVSMHGGRIGVSSEVGKGSTFFVELPYRF